MSRIGPNKIEREREALLRQIHEAFKGVTREGGVSWSETGVIDDYGSVEERAAARAYDEDTSWTELVDDERWHPNQGCGGYPFLDAIGFRYYLPPAMVRVARSRDPNEAMNLRYELTLVRAEGDLRSWALEQWSLLSAEQRSVIKRFVQYMERSSDDWWAKHWRDAYESYWKDV